MSEGRVVLVGGGGFCRELIDAVADCTEAGSLPPLAGYLDDSGDTLSRYGYDTPWLGSVTDYQPGPGDLMVMALGSPKSKRAVFERLSVRGGVFPKLIHPSVKVARTADIAEGCMILFNGAAGPNCRIERFVTINSGSGLGHDASIGEFSTLSSKVDITGNVKLGKDVLVGSNAVFVPGVKIGDGATIGAGSIIYRSVRPGATTFAAPAKLLKMRPA
jgi:sugar O-acyltransferase (sialic acid O-acetyltransferase NeuD family)